MTTGTACYTIHLLTYCCVLITRTSTATEVLAEVIHSGLDIPFKHLTKYSNPVPTEDLSNTEWRCIRI